MIPKLQHILMEELFGVIGGAIEIYKNPKSIKRMDRDLRAVSLPTGDLFVADTRKIIHVDIHKWLRTQGIKLPTMRSVGDVRTAIDSGYINWHRDKLTDTFYLSESTGTEIPKKTIKNVNKYAKKVKQKNPAYKFIAKNIWDK